MKNMAKYSNTLELMNTKAKNEAKMVEIVNHEKENGTNSCRL
jgi:hypothetical protein